MKKNFSFPFVVLGLLAVMSPFVSAQETEFPVQVDAYVFSISETQIRGILEKGITRDELTQLQEKYFEAGCLLPKGKPLTLKIGENPIEISEEQIMDMQEAEDTEVICLFFEMIRKSEDLLPDGKIQRHSYAIALDKEGNQKRIGEKESIWTYPGGPPTYRYVDFRSAILFRYERLVYDLEFRLQDQKEKFTLLFKLAD
ncbi:hypothetical protein GF373_10110 [bacterium]|nr:hypothetical protein [bacterium]